MAAAVRVQASEQLQLVKTKQTCARVCWSSRASRTNFCLRRPNLRARDKRISTHLRQSRIRPRRERSSLRHRNTATCSTTTLSVCCKNFFLRQSKRFSECAGLERLRMAPTYLFVLSRAISPGRPMCLHASLLTI